MRVFLIVVEDALSIVPVGGSIALFALRLDWMWLGGVYLRERSFFVVAKKKKQKKKTKVFFGRWLEKSLGREGKSAPVTINNSSATGFRRINLAKIRSRCWVRQSFFPS